MARMLDTCDGQLLPADTRVVARVSAALDVEEEPKPAPGKKTSAASAAPAAGSGRSCTEIGHPVYAGNPDYFSDLDSDGDGVACDEAIANERPAQGSMKGPAPVNEPVRGLSLRFGVVRVLAMAAVLARSARHGNATASQRFVRCGDPLAVQGAESVGGVVGVLDGLVNAAAVGDLVAVLLGPGADRGGLTCRVGGAGGALAPSAGAGGGLAGCRHEGAQRLKQLFGVGVG